MQVLVAAPQLGSVQGELCDDVHSDAALVLAGRPQSGRFLPLTLINPETQESLSTVCCIKGQGQANASGIAEIRLSLQQEDHALLDRLQDWLTHARVGKPSDSSPSVDGVPATPAVEQDNGDPTPAPPAMSAEQVSTHNDAARVKAERRLQQAAAAREKGELSEAYDLLESVLAVYPVNAAQLHIELSILAWEMGRIGDSDAHAQEAEKLAPDSHQAATMKRRIELLRREKAAASRQRATNVATRKKRLSALQTYSIVGAAAAIALLVIGVAMKIYILPRGSPPREVAQEVLSTIAPGMTGRVYRGVLYVTVGRAKWNGMSGAAKHDRLKKLREMGKRKPRYSRVVISDEEPRVLGMAGSESITVR